ncbi:hypothetical protein [Microcoleus sp. F4-D5]|uniref:hypothetical protein n=1 Tax=Microcoleus sp. F4-D5 TaxID=2818760 RepID=UPI002FD555D5
MEQLQSILKGILIISVALTAVVIYLNIKKLWSRKHDPIVAESTSVFAQLVAVSTSLPFFIYYCFHKDFNIALENLFRLTAYSFYFLVGIGFWVKDPHYRGGWQKLTNAFKQEASESANLIKALNQPSGKKELLNILYRLAWLDDVLDDKERQYIQMFAETWDIDPEYLFTEPPPEKGIEKLQKVYSEVMGYIALNPPKEQALSLSDALQALIRVDEQVTEEEELVAAEVSSLLKSYAGKEETLSYQIIIHPDRQQHKRLLALIPNSQEEYMLGSCAYIVGIFQTRPYAEALCKDYRQQGFFTVVKAYNNKVIP